MTLPFLLLDPIRRALGRPGRAAGKALPAPDPLDHPALRGLTPREIADLPLPRLAPALPAGGA